MDSAFINFNSIINNDLFNFCIKILLKETYLTVLNLIRYIKVMYNQQYNC